MSNSLIRQLSSPSIKADSHNYSIYKITIAAKTFISMWIIVPKKIKTKSHPEMVGNMSNVTLNYGLSKISFVHF